MAMRLVTSLNSFLIHEKSCKICWMTRISHDSSIHPSEPMARIIVNATMIRFPMGGMNQWILTWLVGFHRLGHEVYLVERSEWENDCFDFAGSIMTNDCGYGISVVQPLLGRYGLGANWCFIDHAGHHHGMSQTRLDDLFRTADVFVDFEWGPFFERAAHVPVKIFLDGEPGWFQVKLTRDLEAGKLLRDYDFHFTTGLLIGTPANSALTAGIEWLPTRVPALLDETPPDPARHNGRFTTIMDWKSNKPVEFRGRTYGQKDIEFEKFMELPHRVAAGMEVAVSGSAVPRERLREHGWQVRPANEVTRSVDTYRRYIAESMGEFSVAKNSFVSTRCGWLGDRAGVYLAYGKPVVQQDTGFGDHLPCGRGLFSVDNMEEAAEAITMISADYAAHSRAAREIAEEFLDVGKVTADLLRRAGV
jgi:hypothetical protein